MQTIKINEKNFNLSGFNIVVGTVEKKRRKMCVITVSDTTYSDVAEAFKDISSFEIISGQLTTQWTDYNKIIEIADNMNGTLTVKIAQKLSIEEELIQTNEELKNGIELVIGSEFQDNKQFVEFRESIEDMYLNTTSDDNSKITYRAMAPVWVAGKYEIGAVYTATGQVWECYAAYDNETHPDISPESPAWFTFNRPLHGTTIEIAMPWAKPTNATDQYNIGEYMVYVDNIVYKCIQSTNFSPEEYGEAWEKQVFD